MVLMKLNIYGMGSQEQQSSGSSIILSYFWFITHYSKHFNLVQKFS